MSWKPTLNFSNHINNDHEEFLKIVKTSTDFCKETYFWGLLTNTNGRIGTVSDIDSFLRTITNTTNENNGLYDLQPKFNNNNDYTSSPAIKVTDKFLKYFDSPTRIISCSDPDEYLYSIKSLCDAFFEHYTSNSGLSINMFKYNIITLELISKIYNEVPFQSDDGTLNGFLMSIKSYISSVHVPSYYQSDFNKTIKNIIYASYYPYFIFLYILSFIGSKRESSSYKISRKAKLACYLFIAHISYILYQTISHYNPPSDQVNDYNNKKVLLQQIMANVSVNILEKESTSYDTNKDEWMKKLNELSQDNVNMNKKLLSDNEKYERYKQNVLSASNTEYSIEKQYKSSAFWMIFHIWFFIILLIIVIVIILIPKNVVPNDYDSLAMFIICGITALYTLTMGFIGVLRMLK